jgi:hypothetical protein
VAKPNYEHEQFKLPDGTVVGTGNNEDIDAAMRVSAKPFPDELKLDPKDIERLMKNRSLEKEREKRRPWVQCQGNVGSCNLETAVAMKHHMDEVLGLPHVPLAPNHGYARVNGGRDVGSSLGESYEYMMQAGCCRRELVPANTYNRRQQGSRLKEADADGLHRRIHEPYYLPRNYDEFRIALASAIARRMPINVAWHVGGGSMRLRNGYAVHGRGPGNHATMLHSGKWVGGRDLIHPDFQNSWGPTRSAAYGVVRSSGWGDGGFGLTTPEALFACIRNHPFWVGTTVLEDNRRTDGIF